MVVRRTTTSIFLAVRRLFWLSRAHGQPKFRTLNGTISYGAKLGYSGPCKTTCVDEQSSFAELQGCLRCIQLRRLDLQWVNTHTRSAASQCVSSKNANTTNFLPIKHGGETGFFSILWFEPRPKRFYQVAFHNVLYMATEKQTNVLP